MHVCLVCHVGQGLVIFELLKIVEAIIKRGVALSGLPPATFVVAINELCQIIVNVHILFFQRTAKSGAARASPDLLKKDKFDCKLNCQKRLGPGCHLN